MEQPRGSGQRSPESQARVRSRGVCGQSRPGSIPRAENPTDAGQSSPAAPARSALHPEVCPSL